MNINKIDSICRKQTQYKQERWLTVEEIQIVLDLMKTFNIKVVVEVGTANGYSALCWATSAEHVYTYDIIDRPKLWTLFPEYKNITFYNTPYDGILKVEGPVMYFIDGDHYYKQVKEDWKNVTKTLLEKDIVVFHDTTMPFWDELLLRNISPEVYDITVLSSKRGIAYVTKKKEKV